jgi:lysozyme
MPIKQLISPRAKQLTGRGQLMMQISNNGLSLLKQFEGVRLKSYQDSVGVWTIGYGRTGQTIVPGQAISLKQADQFLVQDLGRVEMVINKLVTVKLNQNQFDALVCFSFNVGTGALASSTLLRLLNSGDYAGAAEQFLRWDKAGGEVLAGLSKRRAAERALFLHD